MIALKKWKDISKCNRIYRLENGYANIICNQVEQKHQQYFVKIYLRFIDDIQCN